MASKITITGKFGDVLGAAECGVPVYFRLRNYGENAPSLADGSGLVVPVNETVWTDSSGAFSVSLWGNDQILPGNTLSPPSTYYDVWLRIGAKKIVVGSYSFTGAGPLDLNTLTAIPVPAPPPMTGSFLGSMLDMGGACYNVKAYGAKGDGVTDDYAAIQTVINLARTNHGTVFFPAGRYEIKTALDCTNLKYVTLRGEGTGSCTLAGGSWLSYSGSAASTAFDFCGGQYWHCIDLGFSPGSAEVCILIGRTTDKGFGEDVIFTRCSIVGGTVAALADVCCEVVMLVDCYINLGFGRGLLFTQEPATYGLDSPYSAAFAVGSMTQVTMRGGKIVGQGTNVELDGRVNSCSDFSFFGVYFSNAGANAWGFKCWGLCQNILIHGARYEVESPSGVVAFIMANAGATLRHWHVVGHDNNYGYLLYSAAASSYPTIFNSEFNCLTSSVSWSGSLNAVKITNYNPINIVVTNGDITNCDFLSNNGVTSFTYTGNLLARINGLERVIFYQFLQAGSCNFTLTDARGGLLIARYNDNIQTAQYHGWSVWAKFVIANLQNMAGAHGAISGLANGTTTTAPVITFAFAPSGNGAYASVQLL